MSDDTDDNDDAKVGYKKPPVDTRFGGPKSNPRGKGRKSRNLKTDLMEELAQQIELKPNGKPVRLTQQRALLKGLMVNAIKGDVRASAKLLDLVLRVIGADDGIAPTRDLTAEDQDILENFRSRGRVSDDG